MDGSGKTTQMAAMEDALDRWGFEVVRSREPGGCPISEKIRALLLDPENKAMDETTEAILYAAARAQGLPAETLMSEYSPGQFEITLHHRADAQRVDL